MEKAETTRDFMNVDSFSQLPFIRPALAKEKPAVRLFGIEVQNSTAEGAVYQNTDTDTNTNNTTVEVDVLTSTTTTTSIDTQRNTANSGRKFECHYCCRNFPTSQALGGHQNAHKRERQHAKRAYLQSAAMLHPAGPTDHHHLYGGLLGYHHHRLGPTHLPSSSWSNSTANFQNSLSRYYPSSNYHSYPSSHNHHHHQPPPINGSPLAMWRIPAVQSHSGSVNRDRSLLQQQYPPPPYPTPPLLPVLGGSGGGLNISVDSSKASQSSQKYVLEAKKGAFPDHVSLDLHL